MLFVYKEKQIKPKINKTKLCRLYSNKLYTVATLILNKLNQFQRYNFVRRPLQGFGTPRHCSGPSVQEMGVPGHFFKKCLSKMFIKNVLKC